MTNGILEICEDVKEECDKYGEVLEMKVPRPSGGSRQSNGVGKIYVKYDTPDSARKALQALAGRKFADRTVVTTYFSEVSLVSDFYDLNQYANPSIGELRGRRLVRLTGERHNRFPSSKELAVKGGLEARILGVPLHLPGLNLQRPNEKSFQRFAAPLRIVIVHFYRNGNQIKSIAFLLRHLANLNASS